MTDAHAALIASVLPQLRDRIVVLGVSDPYGQDLDAYCRCRDQLAERLEELTA